MVCYDWVMGSCVLVRRACRTVRGLVFRGKGFKGRSGGRYALCSDGLTGQLFPPDGKIFGSACCGRRAWAVSCRIPADYAGKAGWFQDFFENNG